jgi:hypothetical protein
MPDNRFCKKIKPTLWCWAAVVGLMSLLVSTAEAQVFGSFGGKSQSSPLAAPAKQQTQPKPAIRQPQPTPNTAPAPSLNNLISPGADEDDEASATQEPEEWNPDKGVVQIRFVGNEVVIDDKPKTLLYMRNFKISQTLDGKTNCSMRFFVRSSATEKITNLSFRLKWPKIETALSFDDVMPNVATYFDYSLIGDGCYSMDSAPNIIVNRCRIKGMSQRQCADTIQWIK